MSYGIAAAVFLAPSAPAGAQQASGFALGTWGGSLDLGFSREKQQTRTQGFAERDFDYRRFDERLTLSNHGMYYLDPRLVTANLALSVGMYQDHAHSDETDTSRVGKLIGYAFDSTFLAQQPYNATLYANRTHRYLAQPFGGRTDSRFENHGAVLRLREDSALRDWGFPYFSSTLGVYREHFDETTTSLGQTFRRDEVRDGLRLDAHKGYETSDLSAHYELVDHRESASNLTTYRTATGGLFYSLDFGPTLNRRWDSRVNYIDRSGLNPVTLFSADELLRLDHYRNLSTSYRYLFTRLDTLSGTTTTNNGIFSLRHSLYRNLVTSVQFSALRRDLPVGEQTNRAAQLDFHYRRGLPDTGRVFGTAGVRYQLNDNRLQTSRIDVVDAPFAAPSPLGGGAGFVLANSFVDASSIVVVDTRGGARLPTVVGVDYDVVQEGNLTRIVPLPTSLVIQPGDPLAVSYSYIVDPSLEYTSTTSWLNAGADFRWINFSVGHTQTEQTPRSGNVGTFLEDRRRDTAQVQLRNTWSALRGRAGAGYERYSATFLAYTRRRFSELLSWFRRKGLSVDLSAEQTHTDYTLPERQADTRSLQLTANWLAPGEWWTTALVGHRVYTDSLSPTDTVDEAKLQARKAYGKLTLASGLAYDDRTRGASEVRGWHLYANMTRRF